MMNMNENMNEKNEYVMNGMDECFRWAQAFFQSPISFHFISFHLCFKVSLSAKPSIWKL